MLLTALFVANVEMNPNEGIYKKIFAQARAIRNICGGCHVITKRGKGCFVYDLSKNTYQYYNNSVLKQSLILIENYQYNIVYIRLMIASLMLLKLMHHIKSKKIKLYYEIPTYPFFYEQYHASRKKYRAIAKIMLDTIFAPWVYYFCTNIVIVKSNSKVKVFNKMIETYNGIDSTNIDIKQNRIGLSSADKFRMVAVGTIFPYHGYDRILYGMKQCDERIDSGRKKVELHIVGESQTTNDLKLLSQSLGLHNVYFHGLQTTEELNAMYKNFDVGLGCLALHRRHANIDTTLKVIEYYCRGVAVVSSGNTPLDTGTYTLHVADTESAINIENLYQQYKLVEKKQLVELPNIARAKFEWDSLLERIVGNGERD